MSQEIINKFKLRLEIIITCLGTEAEERYETVFSQGIFLSASQHDADKLLSKTFMIVFLTFGTFCLFEYRAVFCVMFHI